MPGSRVPTTAYVSTVPAGRTPRGQSPQAPKHWRGAHPRVAQELSTSESLAHCPDLARGTASRAPTEAPC